MTEKTPALLVVDDRPDNLFVIEQLVNEYIPACIVHTAANADIALQIALEYRPDGILSDIQMPGKNGIELCRQLKETPKTSHIPVLLITSHKSDPNLRVQGLEAGADDFIARPIDNLELAARIKVMFRIKHMQDDLIEARGGLEKAVAERTENLKKANDQLILEIEERRRVEEESMKFEGQLRQVQKMESIGTLAGGIAHDFNNILAGILGYVEMAKDDAPPGTQFSNDLDKILIAANRAKDLVKQILTFSRQAQIERIPIKIQPLIKEGLKMLRSTIPTTTSLTEDIDPKSGVILADPTQVNQILMNLCTNAYHAVEEIGGALSVTLKTTFIKSDDQEMLLQVAPGEYVELTVSDTGKGIEPAILEKIFDPFFTTKGIGKGTGMGLSIIHGILKEYGGTITVESHLGKGSAFHVFFPVAKADALSEIIESEDLPQGTERILFVDDEEFLAAMGKDMLERLGYHVTVRRSSIEALAIFQKTPTQFDLVITDQTMPEMTGADLARRMLQIRADIPIILCTGYSSLVDEDSAKALGIKEFALKPLTKRLLAKLIRKVLEGKDDS